MTITAIKRMNKPKGSTRFGAISTFLNALSKIEISDDVVFFFRGHQKSSYQLKPAIYRNEGWIQNEDILFKELILRCPNDLPDRESTFQTLVKMQHYSLPTRLLDITTNPLIALYFACAPETPAVKTRADEDGEVLLFKIPKAEIKYFDSDTVSVIANISRRPGDFSLPIEQLDNSAFNQKSQIKFLLHDIKKEKSYFESSIEQSHLESVVCVKPKLDNPRIIRQDGAFLLFGIDGSKLQHAKMPMKYCASSDSARFYINKEKKKDILDQLKSLGITQASIFPEIEHVAEHIKRTYGSVIRSPTQERMKRLPAVESRKKPAHSGRA